MHTTISGSAHQCSTKNILGLVMAVAAIFQHHNAAALDVIQGTGDDFAVMPGSTRILIPEFVPLAHLANGFALQSQQETTAVYNQAAPQILPSHNLGGLTLAPGVYFFSSSARRAETLSQHEHGNLSGGFHRSLNSGIESFGLGESLAVPPRMGTGLSGNVKPSNNIDTTGPILDGRRIVEKGAVNLGDNVITPRPADINSVPDASSTLSLLGTGLTALFAVKRRFFSLA